MKKLRMVVLVCLTLLVSTHAAQAQIPIIDVIKGAAKKVIKAIDLKIQRQQNKVIWLQNAQKVLENEMSKLKLDEIKDWTQKQKDLYQNYFDELQKVKSLISYYQRIRAITDKQAMLVRSYSRAWSLFRNDTHFSAKELTYMGSVYNGILEETLKNIDQIMLVINSFKTQMTDAQRLVIINQAADRVEQNYTDLQIFNKQNALLSLQRAKSSTDVAVVKKMYGFK